MNYGYSCSIVSSGRNFVQLMQQSFYALAYGFALLLKGSDLVLHLCQMRGLLIEKLLQRRGVLLGEGACFALLLKQLDRAQDALFERAEVVGSKVQFGIFECKSGHRLPRLLWGKFEMFFAEYSWFCTEENDGKRGNAGESNYFDTDLRKLLTLQSLRIRTSLAAYFAAQLFNSRDDALCITLQLVFLQRAVLCLEDGPQKQGDMSGRDKL